MAALLHRKQWSVTLCETCGCHDVL